MTLSVHWTSDCTGIRTSHVVRQGITPGSTAWKSRALTTQPATHQEKSGCNVWIAKAPHMLNVQMAVEVVVIYAFTEYSPSVHFSTASLFGKDLPVSPFVNLWLLLTLANMFRARPFWLCQKCEIKL